MIKSITFAVLLGPPASGKSTFIQGYMVGQRAFSKNMQFLHLDKDNLYEMYSPALGKGRTDSEGNLVALNSPAKKAITLLIEETLTENEISKFEVLGYEHLVLTYQCLKSSAVEKDMARALKTFIELKEVYSDLEIRLEIHLITTESSDINYSSMISRASKAGKGAKGLTEEDLQKLWLKSNADYVAMHKAFADQDLRVKANFFVNIRLKGKKGFVTYQSHEIHLEENHISLESKEGRYLLRVS